MYNYEDKYKRRTFVKGIFRRPAHLCISGSIRDIVVGNTPLALPTDHAKTVVRGQIPRMIVVQTVDEHGVR